MTDSKLPLSKLIMRLVTITLSLAALVFCCIAPPSEITLIIALTSAINIVYTLGKE
jgi:1,4-dihydroxy-2-naphthoate octaprenyltransferase